MYSKKQPRNRTVRVNRQQRNPRGKGENRVRNTRASTGFPDSEIATLRYSEEVGITGATYGQYTFRGNSAFDPNETGVGHQPSYFDQYAAVYSKYKVISSTCRVTASNYNSSASAVVVLSPSSDIVTITSYSIAMEQPYSKRTEYMPVSTRMGCQASVRKRMTTRRILGLSPSQFASEDYSALTGASPSSIWYWNVSAFDISEVSVRLIVDIDYHVLFYDRKAAVLSYGIRVVKTPEEIDKRKKALEVPPVTNYVVPVDKPVRRMSL